MYRLFVGWVPKDYTEERLRPLFEEFGRVEDIKCILDPRTGASRGCAFVSYSTREEAELAIKGFNTKKHLPGSASPLEVRFSRSHQYVQPGAGPSDNKQLFFTKAQPAATEEQVLSLFTQFGIVEQFCLFRDRNTGRSKGSGFVSMQTREAAIKALESLNNESDPNSESTISVQWADPDLQDKKKKAVESSNADNRMLFFAKVLRSATEDDIRELFSQFGKVFDVNVFRAFQGALTTKGCGLVTMAHHDEAVAAIEALDSKYVWGGMDSPMVVKWMDAALQRRRREQHLATMRQGAVSPNDLNWMQQNFQQAAASSSRAGLMGGLNLPMMGGGGLGQFMHSGLTGGLPHGMQMAGPSLQPEVEAADEMPPVGCAADAIKLFIGNIPKSCTEEQLMPFFETIGKVVELVVVREKATHESKGSAFVWYSSRVMAERAILQFNLRHVLPDPSGEQDRPLVVRKAKIRARAMNSAPVPSSSSSFPLFGKPDHGMGGLDLQSLYPHLTHLHPQPLFPYQDPTMMMGGMGRVPGPSNPTLGLMDSLAGLSLQPHQLLGNQAMPGGGGGGLNLAARYGGGLDMPQQNMPLPDALAYANASQLFDAQTIPVSQQQLATINQPQIYGMIQSVSGAQINVTQSPNPGIFNLIITGRKDQVDSAKDLIGSIIGSSS